MTSLFGIFFELGILLGRPPLPSRREIESPSNDRWNVYEERYEQKPEPDVCAPASEIKLRNGANDERSQCESKQTSWKNSEGNCNFLSHDLPIVTKLGFDGLSIKFEGASISSMSSGQRTLRDSSFAESVWLLPGKRKPSGVRKNGVVDLAGGISRGLSRHRGGTYPHRGRHEGESRKPTRLQMTKKVPRSTTAKYYIGLDIYGSTISNACAAAGGSAPVQQIVLEAWSGRHDSP